MAKPVTDYRARLHSKWDYTPIHREKLRTRKRAGDVEIVRDHRDGQHKLFRHGAGFEEARG